VSFPHHADAATSGSSEELDPDEVLQLSPRQREILDLRADGYSNAEIAEMLGISDSTVRFQMHRARQKLSEDRPGSETESLSQHHLYLPPSARGQAQGTAKTRGSNKPWPDGSFIHQLSDADRAALLDVGTPVRFEDDQILLAQGDAGDFLYVLTGGLVKIIVAAVSGAQTMLAIRSRGDLVGEVSVLDGKPQTSTARATGPVTAMRIGGGAFLTLSGRSPEFQTAVTHYLLGQLRASTERRAAERVWDAKERIAQVLFDLGQKHAQPDSDGLIRIPLMQSELGELAGVAVSTAERVLKDLRKQGALSTRYREITIRDMAYLNRIRFLEEKPESPYRRESMAL
jgi:CRP-like cAMP-binding protein